MLDFYACSDLSAFRYSWKKKKNLISCALIEVRGAAARSDSDMFGSAALKALRGQNGATDLDLPSVNLR